MFAATLSFFVLLANIALADGLDQTTNGHCSNAATADGQCSNVPTVFTEVNVIDLLNNVFGEQETWIPDSDVFGDSPLDYFTNEVLDAGFDKGDPRAYLKVTEDVVGFDMFDKFAKKAYFTMNPENIPDAAAFEEWCMKNKETVVGPGSVTFGQRFLCMQEPKPQADVVYWVASSGLAKGEQRNQTIIGVLWYESTYIKDLAKHPECGNPRSGQKQNIVTYSLLMGGRLGIYAGNEDGSKTVVSATDANGNVYFLWGQRSSNADIVANMEAMGWTADLTHELKQDVRTSCIDSALVPGNQDGNDGVICKQLQFNDKDSNSFMLMAVGSQQVGHPLFPSLEIQVPRVGCQPYPNLTSTSA